MEKSRKFASIVEINLLLKDDHTVSGWKAKRDIGGGYIALGGLGGGGVRGGK